MMLEYDFMQSAFAASGLVALVAGVVGYFLVLRRQAFAGHALSHVGFAGATGAALLGWNPMTGLLLVTLLASTWMGSLADRLERSDVATAAVLSLALGFGMLFLHFYTSYATEATALLFGNVLAVDGDTLWLLAVIGAVCLVVLALISRPLVFASLQPELAEAKGVPMRGISILFLGVVALCTAECIQIVGVLLVFTLMVGPAATVQQLTTSLKRGVLLSALLALLEAWGGLTLAYYTDWPTSFWITALSSSAYLLATLWVQWQRRQTAPFATEHSHSH
jgi:zinc/manganese transport system permease protein